MDFDAYVKRITNFINEYREFIDCHLIDFITEGLWEKCLQAGLRYQIEMCINNNTNIDANPLVNDFIHQTKSLSLETCLDIINGNYMQADILNSLTSDIKFQCVSANPESDFMKAKKHHEVEVLGKVLATMAEKTSSLVIDAGAGKAYLSTHLTEVYRIPVLAIDSSQTCHNGAVVRQKKMQKKKKQFTPTIQYLVEEINNTTDYTSIVKLHFPNWNVQENLILTGLHTCGSLTDSLINVFLRERHIRCIVIVPCCYHLTHESLGKRFKLSRNAKMLAQQSVERTVKDTSVHPVLFHRALLQVLLHSMGLNNVRVGRGGPKNDFPTYARWALEKIGVDTEKVPSDKELDEMYQNYQHFKRKFEIFQILRIYLSNVVEASVMLERIMVLKESKHCSSVGVLRLFNPLLSPRCHALFAAK